MMLRIGTRRCVHHLRGDGGRSLGRLIGSGNVGVRRSVSKQEHGRSVSWKSVVRWRHTAVAEAPKEEEEEAQRDPQDPDDEAPPSTLPSSNPGHKPPASSPTPTSKSSTEEDKIIPLLRAQYDLPAYLRPYQVQVIDACMKALGRDVKRIGVSCPTGSGKTVIL